jgi:zinc transporter ZupT
MMVAASYSLFVEGCTYSDPSDNSWLPAPLRTVVGAVLGLLFILATKKFLDQYEDLKVGVLGGANARKALLIFFVMTLHSFSEGVGIGVSFGGLHGSDLGVFISASLAVHNVPEGLAIAVVLLPRGVSIVTAAVWAIATSLPQPLMAVPSYMFVHSFIPILPMGLGFAGGAMAWVAFFELLMEAVEDTDWRTTCCAAIPSLLVMLIIQHFLDDETSGAARS